MSTCDFASAILQLAIGYRRSPGAALPPLRLHNRTQHLINTTASARCKDALPLPRHNAVAVGGLFAIGYRLLTICCWRPSGAPGERAEVRCSLSSSFPPFPSVQIPVPSAFISGWPLQFDAIDPIPLPIHFRLLFVYFVLHFPFWDYSTTSLKNRLSQPVKLPRAGDRISNRVLTIDDRRTWRNRGPIRGQNGIRGAFQTESVRTGCQSAFAQ